MCVHKERESMLCLIFHNVLEKIKLDWQTVINKKYYSRLTNTFYGFCWGEGM